jgi:hypothetical protein
MADWNLFLFRIAASGKLRELLDGKIGQTLRSFSRADLFDAALGASATCGLPKLWIASVPAAHALQYSKPGKGSSVC